MWVLFWRGSKVLTVVQLIVENHSTMQRIQQETPTAKTQINAGLASLNRSASTTTGDNSRENYTRSRPVALSHMWKMQAHHRALCRIAMPTNADRPTPMSTSLLARYEINAYNQSCPAWSVDTTLCGRRPDIATNCPWAAAPKKPSMPISQVAQGKHP